MKYLIFLFLILALVFVVFYYQNKQLILRRQLIATNSQNNNLKSKYNKTIYYKKNVEILYMTPTNTLGLIKEGTTLQSSPLKDSAILQKTNIKMEVRILDKAKVCNETWYYIALPIDSNINSRGWVKASDFTLIYSNCTNITKRF